MTGGAGGRAGERAGKWHAAHTHTHTHAHARTHTHTHTRIHVRKSNAHEHALAPAGEAMGDGCASSHLNQSNWPSKKLTIHGKLHGWEAGLHGRLLKNRSAPAQSHHIRVVGHLTGDCITLLLLGLLGCVLELITGGPRGQGGTVDLGVPLQPLFLRLLREEELLPQKRVFVADPHALLGTVVVTPRRAPLHQAGNFTGLGIPGDHGARQHPRSTDCGGEAVRDGPLPRHGISGGDVCHVDNTHGRGPELNGRALGGARAARSAGCLHQMWSV